MDTTTLGETAAELMGDLAEEFDEGSAIGVVLVIAEVKGEDEDGDWTTVRFRCSDRRIWVQNGLLHFALHADVAAPVDDEDDE